MGISANSIGGGRISAQKDACAMPDFEGATVLETLDSSSHSIMVAVRGK